MNVLAILAFVVGSMALVIAGAVAWAIWDARRQAAILDDDIT